MNSRNLRMAVAVLVLTSMVSSAQAASLGRLLGVPQPAAERRVAVTEVRSLGSELPSVSRPRTIDRSGATNVPGQLGQATPRFPILRKAIILYLLYVLQNPYR